MPESRHTVTNLPGPETLAEVLKVFELYKDEAAKCAEADACLAGCVLLASALEASLLAMTRCFPVEVARFAASSKARELGRPASDWGLSQLLTVARGLRWLPESEETQARMDPERAQVGDLVDVIRMVRNLIHPAIYLKDYEGERLDSRALEVSFRILDASCSSLTARLEDALAANLPLSGPNSLTPKLCAESQAFEEAPPRVGGT